MSEPRKSLKRKSSTLKSSQSEGENDATLPKRKKTESGKVETPTDKGKSKKTNDKQTPVERSTRRSRASDVTTDSADKKTAGAQNKHAKATKAIQKEKKASNIPTRSRNKVDQTEKTIANKKAAPHESAKNSKKVSDTQPPPSNRRTRTSSQSAANVSLNVSSSKPTSALTPVVTPQPRTVNKISTRQRLIASAPSIQNVPSRRGMKNTTSPKAQKDTSPRLRSSLSNLDNSSNLNTPQHRTRRAIANEFKVNNVMTRNRSSTDGVKVLVKVKKLPMTRRKSSVGMDLPEKTLSAGKSKKNVEKPSKIPLRPRRLKILEKK